MQINLLQGRNISLLILPRIPHDQEIEFAGAISLKERGWTDSDTLQIPQQH